jgi:hypothetical protein
MNCYLLAGETEFFRAYRNYSGVLHFVYLTCSYPGVYTADHFQDIGQLKLNPYFEKYLADAFNPLGVYLNFWQPDLQSGSKRQFRIMMVTDWDEAVVGRLVLTLENAEGKELKRAMRPFELARLGAASFDLELDIPQVEGKCLLKAVAIPSAGEQVASRRKVTLRSKGQ